MVGMALYASPEKHSKIKNKSRTSQAHVLYDYRAHGYERVLELKIGDEYILTYEKSYESTKRYRKLYENICVAGVLWLVVLLLLISIRCIHITKVST